MTIGTSSSSPIDFFFAPLHPLRYATDADIYGKLAKSIAPEIFGHEDVKKARRPANCLLATPFRPPLWSQPLAQLLTGPAAISDRSPPSSRRP